MEAFHLLKELGIGPCLVAEQFSQHFVSAHVLWIFKISNVRHIITLLFSRAHLATRISTPRTSMRKELRQARSRPKVDGIVQVGAHILGSHGWAGFNTNDMADAAGVSIGSRPLKKPAISDPPLNIRLVIL